MDKLRTYKLFKKTFGLEEYLEFGLERKYRQCLSSFRISAHKLQIERGRYLGKNVEERKCTDCNVIEDENISFVTATSTIIVEKSYI